MKYILILSLLIPNLAHAANTKPPKKQKQRVTQPAPKEQPVPEEGDAPAPKEPTVTTSSDVMIPKIRSRKGRWSFVPRGLFWQEDIEAKELGQTAAYQTQLMGISLGLNRTYPLSSRRWVPFYGADLAFGTLKSAGESVGLVDAFKNQPWYWLGATGGISYRPSGNSEIRALVPLGVRMIQWKSSRDSLEMGQKTSFTTGLGIVSATKIGGGTSSVLTGFTHLYQWRATLWQVGFEYLF